MGGMPGKNHAMIWNKRIIAIAVALLLLTPLLFFTGYGCGKKERASDGKLALDDVKITARDLGKGWELEEEALYDPDQAAPDSNIGMLGELGAGEVLNQVFTRGEERLQVNYVLFGDSEEAMEGVVFLEEGGGGENIYGARENVVVEIISDSAQTSEMAAGLLKIKTFEELVEEIEGKATYQVEFKIATVSNLNYMEANNISLYLEEYQEGEPVDPSMQPLLDFLTPCNYIQLFTQSGDKLKAEYSFGPEGKAEPTELAGITKYIFQGDPGDLPNRAGVPYVTVRGDITVRPTDINDGDGTTLKSGERTAYLSETSFWPTTNPEVQELSKEITGSLSGDAKKVEAMWSWVRENIEYKGPVGTRYGTMQVLSQRYGRCWDKCDVFVTLCRASGVPARQVGGWFADESGGHIWAQSYIEGKGWVAVDTTNNRVGDDISYVPFFATADGEMPIIYIEVPRIEVSLGE